MATRKKAAKPKSKAAVKKSTKKIVKLKAKPVAKAATVNGLPRPSTKPWGQAGRALDGVRILDFTHVQSGPTCTQLLAYMGANVIRWNGPARVMSRAANSAT
jgi:formyl-CoA transferase